jgi:hypothetical protein
MDNDIFNQVVNFVTDKLKKKKNAKDEIKFFLKRNEIDYNTDFKEDCNDYDVLPTVLPAVRRIIAIGDTHGDYDLAVNSLKLGEVINDKFEWIGGDTIVVQIGDQIDRCRPFNYTCENKEATVDDEASDIKILKLFSEINEKAKNHGGKVISLLGNHEVMNSQGNMTYVSFKGREEFENYIDPKTKEKFPDGLTARKHAFKPGNEYANFMACTRLSCVIIGSNIFVHAAIVPRLMEKYKINSIKGLEAINTIIRKWLLGKITIENIQNILNSDTISPFWPRILGHIPPNVEADIDCDKYLDPVLKTLELKNMIIGHTPQFYVHKEGINSTCNSRVWRVDIGSSKAFRPFDQINCSHDKKRIQVLEILDDNKFRVMERK